MDGYNSCGYGYASHPILLSSDNNVSVAENTVPIRIQVEHSPPADRVVSQQRCIRSSGVICHPKCTHSSKLSYIAGLECRTTSSYQIAKAIKHIHWGEARFPRSRLASLGFADADTDSDDCGRDPTKSSGIMSCTFPGGQGFSPVSGTDDEVVGQGHRGHRGGVGYICMRGGWRKNI